MKYFLWFLIFSIPNFTAAQVAPRVDVRIPTKDWEMQRPEGVDGVKPQKPQLYPGSIGSAQIDLGIAQTEAIKKISDKLEKLDARVKLLESVRSK